MDKKIEPSDHDDAYSGCLACVLKFFYALDIRDHETAASMMAPEGVWHRQGVALQGRAAVLEALAQRPESRRTCHIITNFRILEASPGRAEAAFYLTAYDGSPAAGTGNGPDGPRLLAIRDCRDGLTLTPGGWRIAEKRSIRHLPPE